MFSILYDVNNYNFGKLLYALIMLKITCFKITKIPWVGSEFKELILEPIIILI